VQRPGTDKSPRRKKEASFNAPRMVIMGFAAAIIVGGILLMLPFSYTATGISAIDALFTSTSAVCVTGLTVLDTGHDFSLFGQLVILLLIQMGGLGIMTFSTLLILYMGGAMSLRYQLILKEALNKMSYSNLGLVVKMIVAVTAVAELVGFFCLLPVFLRDFPPLTAAYYALFHSISAFCNAGFSLFPNSMMGYHNNFFLIITMSLLIIAGGVGFTVIIDLIDWLKSRKLSLHTKFVLVMTASLIVVGTLGIFLFETKHNLEYHEGLSSWNIFLTAFFQSVSARTAGFNTVETGGLATSSLFLIMILMFVGASPGGTGGGIKTSTFGLLLAAAWSIIKGRKSVNLLGRRMSETLLLRSFTIALLYISLVALMTMLMLSIKNFGLSNTLFEVVSAAGTVGLSTGITPDLTQIEKLIIIFTMFCGRLGPLTVATAFVTSESRELITLPEGKIMIG